MPREYGQAYNERMQLIFYLVSFLVTALVEIDQFIAEFWFAVLVLTVHPLVMFHWTRWFLRTLKQLRG